MTTLLLINAVASLLMLGLAFHRATAGALQFYPATIPTIAQAAVALATAVVGLVCRRRMRFILLIISGVALGTLGVPAMYAMSQWPGGDDGGGFGWLFIVGSGCAASFILALVTTILGIFRRKREEQKVGARGLWWLWGIVIVAGLYLIWVVAGPISWTTTRTESHPGGIEIRSIDLHELMPLFPLPFHHSVDTNHERTLIINGREVLRSNDYRGLYPSPTGAYVVAEHWLHTGPILIYATADSRCTELLADESEDEFPDHYYVYPFCFLRWEDDSNFLVEVTGTDWTQDPATDYRQVWRVAANTGVRTRVALPD